MSETGILSGYIDRETLCRELAPEGKQALSARTIRRYEKEADGLPFTTYGGYKRYRVEAVREWLKRRERRPNPRRAA